MNFSERLRELRENMGLSQEGLAEILDIPRSTLTNYENSGGRMPRQERLKRIADYFGVSVDYLIGRSSTSELNPSEERFIEDLDKLSLEEIITKYAPELDKKKATKEKIEVAIEVIRFLKNQK